MLAGRACRVLWKQIVSVPEIHLGCFNQNSAATAASTVFVEKPRAFYWRRSSPDRALAGDGAFISRRFRPAGRMDGSGSDPFSLGICLPGFLRNSWITHYISAAFAPADHDSISFVRAWNRRRFARRHLAFHHRAKQSVLSVFRFCNCCGCISLGIVGNGPNVDLFRLAALG